MKRYAVIDGNGVVNNIVLWDEASAWQPPEGHSMVKAEEIVCDIGWVYTGEIFQEPAKPEENLQPPTSDPEN
jgi:hypothetical protein